MRSDRKVIPESRACRASLRNHSSLGYCRPCNLIRSRTTERTNSESRRPHAILLTADRPHTCNNRHGSSILKVSSRDKFELSIMKIVRPWETNNFLPSKVRTILAACVILWRSIGFLSTVSLVRSTTSSPRARSRLCVCFQAILSMRVIRNPALSPRE